MGLTYIYVQHEVNFLWYHVVYFALLYYYMINVGAEIIAKLFRNYGALYITPADYRNILLLSLETYFIKIKISFADAIFVVGTMVPWFSIQSPIWGHQYERMGRLLTA